MNYRFRQGDRVYFKVMVGTSSVPLEKEEVIKLTKALNEEQEGLMVFKMGIVRLDKVNGIVPDYDRMEDYNVNGISAALPNIGEKMLEVANEVLTLNE